LAVAEPIAADSAVEGVEVAEPAVEPAAEPAAEPVAESAAEPVAEPEAYLEVSGYAPEMFDAAADSTPTPPHGFPLPVESQAEPQAETQATEPQAEPQATEPQQLDVPPAPEPGPEPGRAWGEQ
jgi:hypothetical protein